MIASHEQKGGLQNSCRCPQTDYSHILSAHQAHRLRNPATANILFGRIALLLGSLHLTTMAALGIWLWSIPQSFGTIDSSSCAIENAYLAILGFSVRLGSSALRIVSLVVYALFLLPGLNLFLPMAVPLAAYFWHHNHIAKRCASQRRLLDSPQTSVLAIRAGLTVLLAVNVVFIVDIELTLRRNCHLQDGEDEARWQFGQILAMLLVSMPLRDIAETILARREKRHVRQVKERDDLIKKYEAQNELRKAIYRQSFDDIMYLVEFGGAHPDVATEGETSLPLTLYHPS